MVNIYTYYHTKKENDFMNRGKSEFKKIVRVSLVLDQEHLDCVKKAAINLSVREGRLITTSELMRLTLKERYPVSEFKHI